MQQGASGIDRLIAMGIRQQSYEHIVALLRLQGRAEDAALLKNRAPTTCMRISQNH